MIFISKNNTLSRFPVGKSFFSGSLRQPDGLELIEVDAVEVGVGTVGLVVDKEHAVGSPGGGLTPPLLQLFSETYV